MYFSQYGIGRLCLTVTHNGTGQYKCTAVENYEEFLKALNVGFMLRKAALASSPVMTITEEGGKWTMITKVTSFPVTHDIVLYILLQQTTMKSIELRFELGKEFDEETTDGR